MVTNREDIQHIADREEVVHLGGSRLGDRVGQRSSTSPSDVENGIPDLDRRDSSRWAIAARRDEDRMHIMGSAKSSRILAEREQ